MINTKRLGVSIGMALTAGVMAAAFGVLAAILITVGTALVVALLGHLFPRGANKVLDRLQTFLSE